ncbi:hypothetical protein PVT67_08925 [Gallaecimonas kandeliae]|uniref:hypothetical protein n=1 Tax=Gallaecimonas kandeliae TaxID=3029055 RepID=UPI002647EC91|nr:hypothetical protein [Gallaecimonas kandeliae]WKE67336.1 hypothetical protein PVT67_08925 [Gallaecimonas kandeliae]
MGDYFGDAQQARSIADELGISVEEWLQLDVDLNADTGHDGDMVYGYYFIVPDNAEPSLLAKTGWHHGQTVRISATAVDSEPDFYEEPKHD